MGKAFDKLAKHVEHEYEKKGIGHLKAQEIGRETAAKVYREQLANKKHK